MKISILLPHFKKYGGVRRYLEFGRRLLERNNEVLIFAQNPVVTNFVRELGFNEKSIASLSQLKEWESDVCICGDAGVSRHLYLSKAKVRIVNIIFPYWSNYVIGQYGNIIFDPTLTIVGNGSGWESEHDNINKSLIPLNWFTLPGAINLEMFKKVPVAREFNKFKVLFQGRNRPWKNLNIITNAYGILNSKYSDIKFGYIGTEELPGIPKDINTHINIPQEEMKTIYSSYDCYVSCETLAGWQNCAAEALACELPVITTDIGTKDFAIHHKTALVMNREELHVDLLVKRISTLKNSKPLRQALSKVGKVGISELSWDKYTDAWVTFLEERLTNINSIDIETVSNSILKFKDQLVQSNIRNTVVKSVEVSKPVVKANFVPSYASSITRKQWDAIKANNKPYKAGEVEVTHTEKKDMPLEKQSEPEKELSKDQVISILDDFVKKSKDNPKIATNPDEFIKEEVGDIKKAVGELAYSLRNFLNENSVSHSAKIGDKGSKAFDKYKRLGPYHWDSKDKPYNQYVKNLLNIFSQLREIHPFLNICDVGGGDGAIAYKLACLGFNIELVETDDYALKLAKKMISTKANSLPKDVNIDIINQSFFDLAKHYECVLVSQVIEHFNVAENAVSKLFELNPNIIIVTTPLAKSDGTLWDAGYHTKEFTMEGFKDLFKPMVNKYAISYGTDGVYNQYIVLQNKEFLTRSYIEGLNLLKTSKEKVGVKLNNEYVNEMIDTLKSIFDLKVNTMELK